MTKKDHVKIAEVIARSRSLGENDIITITALEYLMSEMLQSDNSRFDPEKFSHACKR